MASFADPSDLVTFYDGRRVRELASDSGTPVATGDIATDEVLLAVLARATEAILMSVRVGERYTEDELQELADSADSWSGITGLTCDLAFGYLVMRRGTGAADLDRLSPAFGAAQRTLQLLEEGALIFARIDGDQHPDAGNPRTADLSQQTTTPTNSWAAAATQRLIPSSPLNGNLNYPYA